MRKEVHDFMLACEQLIGVARLRKERLSVLECEAILHYAQELERDVFKQYDPSASMKSPSH